MSDIFTANFAGWGYRELEMAAELLEAFSDRPVRFLDQSTLTVNISMSSGKVFLSDEDYNVGVMEEGKLVQFYSCPNCDYEGTQDDAKYDDKDFEKYKGYCSAECSGEDEDEEEES